jgi:hypothetical protein
MGGLTGAGIPFNGQMTGDLSFLNGTGKIITTNNGSIRLVPHGTGIVLIGAAATSHALAASGDLMVSGACEINGTLWADGALIAAGGITANGGMIMGGQLLSLGSSTYLQFKVNEGLMLMPGAAANQASNNVVVTTVANYNKSHGLASISAHPSLRIFSQTDPTGDALQHLWMYHDTTQGHVRSRKGPLEFSAPAAEPTLVNNGSWSVSLDEAAHALKIRVKYSDGTVKNLTTPLAVS